MSEPGKLLTQVIHEMLTFPLTQPISKVEFNQ